MKYKMTKLKSICVFCGSRLGNKKSFQILSNAVGKILGQNKIKLIYGGGSVGLMGVIANSVMENAIKACTMRCISGCHLLISKKTAH